MTEELKPMSLRDALRDSPCPRPANDQPADQNVGACVDKGLCGCQNGQALAGGVAQGQPDNDVRWAVNVLLERIAEKFEANDTFDIWRSDAAATVRSFKHDLASPPAEGGNGNRTLPFDRDTLGRMVREAWVRWAETQAAPKPSWLLPYDDLAEADKEADRQIGETIARWTLIGDAAASGRSPAGTKTDAEHFGDILRNEAVRLRAKADDLDPDRRSQPETISQYVSIDRGMKAVADDCREAAKEYAKMAGSGRRLSAETVANAYIRIADSIDAARLAVPSTELPPAKPKPSRWPQPGDKMRFLGQNGYQSELEAAMKIFTVGNEYTVHACDVQSFSHSVQFVGVKGHFNGVMFELSPQDRQEAK